MISSQSLMLKEYLWENISVTPAAALLFLSQPFPQQAAVRALCLTGPGLAVLQTRQKCQLGLDAACSLLPDALMPLAHPQNLSLQPDSATERQSSLRQSWPPACLHPTCMRQCPDAIPTKNAPLFDPAWQLTKSHSSCWHQLVFHLPRLRIKGGTSITRRQGHL